MIFETEKANCITADPDLFFPENNDEYKVKVPLAKKICIGCPVAVACVTTAIENNYPGVWGGTTESERKGLKYNARSKKIFLDRLSKQ